MDEYKQASAILQSSVEELQATTVKASGLFFRLPLPHGSKQVSTHLKRIEAMEKDLKAMDETTVAKDEFTKLQVEARKLYDGLHIGLSPRLLRPVPGSLISRTEFLDLRSHVWGIRGYNPLSQIIR